jgi:hypothetical protein
LTAKTVDTPATSATELGETGVSEMSGKDELVESGCRERYEMMGKEKRYELPASNSGQRRV